MIEVNITLVVQAVHFLIAWWALSKFLFRPLVGVVRQERALKKRLTTFLQREQHVLEEIKKEQEREWARYRCQFKKNVPLLPSHIALFDDSVKKRPAQEVSEQEEQQAIVAVAERVAKGIAYG
mgnify:CR=1 FL=1